MCAMVGTSFLETRMTLKVLIKVAFENFATQEFFC